MKHKLTRVLFSIFFLVFSYGVEAQVNGIGEFIRGGVSDGQKLMIAYLYPYEKALGYTAVDGRTVYLQTKENDGLHFGFGLKVNTIMIKNTDLQFDVNTLGLERMEPADAAVHISPTVFGDTTGIKMKSKDEFNLPFQLPLPVATFNTPGGIGFHYLPIPELQFSSSFKNTRIMFSGYYVPIQNVLLIGYNISLSSQITSYFNYTKDFPVQLEIMGGFGGSSQHVGLNVQPDAKVEALAKGPYDNQAFLLNISGYNFGLGVNYRIPHLIFYAKAYYLSYSSHTQVVGNYPVNVKDPTGTIGINVEDVTDPIDYRHSFSDYKFTFGTQFNFLKFFYLKGDYSISSYSNFNIGLGIRI